MKLYKREKPDGKLIACKTNRGLTTFQDMKELVLYMKGCLEDFDVDTEYTLLKKKVFVRIKNQEKYIVEKINED